MMFLKLDQLITQTYSVRTVTLYKKGNILIFKRTEESYIIDLFVADYCSSSYTAIRFRNFYDIDIDRPYIAEKHENDRIYTNVFNEDEDLDGDEHT
jgi:hypothetical protein